MGRKVVKNYDITSECTGINVNLLKRLNTLVTVINSGFMLNMNAYNIYAKETMDIITQEYS